MGSSTYELVNAMGTGADNVIFPEFVLAEDPLPHQREFVELYRKEYQVLPKNVEAMAFDGLHVLAQALGKVGAEAGGPKICEALRGPYAGVFAKVFSEMLDAIATHGIKPVIDREFGFAEAPAALAHLKSGGHFGKIVIRVGS